MLKALTLLLGSFLFLLIAHRVVELFQPRILFIEMGYFAFGLVFDWIVLKTPV